MSMEKLKRATEICCDPVTGKGVRLCSLLMYRCKCRRDLCKTLKKYKSMDFCRKW